MQEIFSKNSGCYYWSRCLEKGQITGWAGLLYLDFLTLSHTQVPSTLDIFSQFHVQCLGQIYTTCTVLNLTWNITGNRHRPTTSRKSRGQKMPCSTFCGWGGKPGIYTTRITPPVLSLFHYGRSGEFHLNVPGSLKRRLGRISKLSELIQRRSDIEARMISTMRGLNSAYSMAKQRTQVSLHCPVRWTNGGTENGSQSSHPVHGISWRNCVACVAFKVLCYRMRYLIIVNIICSSAE